MVTKATARVQQPKASLVSRTLLTPTDLVAANPREWLAQEVMLAGSPAVIVGRRIELTWFALDLAVSLACGTPFLGRFAVPRPRRIAVYTYGMDFADVRSQVNAIAMARGADLATSGLHLGKRGPSFRSRSDYVEVLTELKGEGIEAVLINPIREAIRTGQSNGHPESEADRVVALGNALLESGITPIFTHVNWEKTHGLKLADLSYAGLRDYVGQWMMISPLGSVKMYGPGAYRLGAFGFGGQAGQWVVQVADGRLNKDFSGRRWEVVVTDESHRTEQPAIRNQIVTAEDVRRAHEEEAVTQAEKRNAKKYGNNPLPSLDNTQPSLLTVG